MKKVIISLVLGGGIVYGTLCWNPSLLCVTIESCVSDSTKVDSTVAPEVSPAVLSLDTAKEDSVK